MKIPKFWARATAEATSPQGEPVAFSCWRPSDVGQSDAHESALAAAQRILDALLRGQKLDRYAYGCVPLREEVTNTLSDAAGNPLAVVTRNQYGSLVLNAERVMFVDIDFPAITPGAVVGAFFARRFGRAKKSPESEHEEKAKADVERFVAANPEWSVRLYRTRAGLRGLVTHDLFDPTSSTVLDILERLGSDPLYVRLCKAQECFRARLTPKPWRCGLQANPVRYPVEDADAAKQFARWEADYQARQRGYATCRFLGEVGRGRVHPDVRPVVELHDFVTRCSEPLELA